MHIATQAMSIQFIDGKCHIKKQKSHKTALSGYYACVSCDLLLMPLGWTHTHANVCRQNNFKKPGRNFLALLKFHNKELEYNANLNLKS